MQRNWRELTKPRTIKVDQDSRSGFYAKLSAEPLERGFGITIGNALRRVLLSTIRGAAITSVKIDGVLHEFSTIADIREDVAEIVLNLKGIDLRLEDDVPRFLTAKLEGEREVTAADLFTDPRVTVLNPGHHICSMGQGALLNIEMKIQSGVGYHRADQNNDPDAPVGTIPIDSMFTPIRKVNYRVTNARVGQRADYDRLTLEVWTNGAVDPVDAVGIAAKIVKEQFQVFINFDEANEVVEVVSVPTGVDEVAVGPVESEVGQTEVLYRQVEELDLSVRAQNCLQNAGIRYVGELVQRTEQEMLKTRNFGRKSLKEIKDVLSDLGLSLGMQLDGFEPENKA